MAKKKNADGRVLVAPLDIGQVVDGYEIVDAKAASRRKGDATPLGSGATAVVYRCKQTLAGKVTVDRAIKIFSPTGDVLAKRKKSGESEGIGSFVREIAAISHFNHQNLVKIIDAGWYAKKFPFF